MTTRVPLPGFERLVTICRQHSLPVELSPPLASAPTAGELLFGQPVDPLLTALYQRMGGATLGRLSLLRPDMEWDGLVPWNEQLKRDDRAPFRSTLVFGQKTGFSYYVGTVPALADAQGLQPVVYIPYYPGETSSIPVASNLDRFFDTYSRYLELLVVDAEYVETGSPQVTFPWDIAHLVAQDRSLLALIRAGRFASLLNDDHEAREWMSTLLNDT
jgi:hypothetical protein